MGRQIECIEFESEQLLVAVESSKQRIIEEILNGEVGVTIRLLEWQSKYNSYVVYDYEPFGADGFIVNFYITGEEAKLKFLQAMIKKTLTERALLEKCLKQQSAQVHNEVQR